MCCEVPGTVGQRIFDFVSMVLAAGLSALAAGQHIWFDALFFWGELVRPTIDQSFCLLDPMYSIADHHIQFVWVYSSDYLAISGRIVGFQDLVGNNHLFCVWYLSVVVKESEAYIVHG